MSVKAELPRILYEKDIKNYKKIFELIPKGRFTEINKIVKDLNNDILLGYILKGKYLSPYYKTSFKEVKDWLLNYNDLPNANEIYKLGLRKGARRELKKPNNRLIKTQFFTDDYTSSYKMIQHSYKHLPKKQRDEVAYILKIFNRRLRQGYTKNARQILENPTSKKYLYKDDYLRMQAYLAHAYYLNNETDMAILWSLTPAKELNYYLANWTLGLSYWRQNNYLQARNSFKEVAFSKQIPSDVVSSAAYWAYKSNENIEDSSLKDFDNIFLEIASNFPKTFYGILATHKLNRKLTINWEEPSLNLDNIRELISYKSGMRAFALLQLNMKKEAEEELKFLLHNENSDNYSNDLTNAILAVAELANLPSLSINISNYIKEYSDLAIFASPKYPILNLSKEKSNIDIALVNALIRQESRFNQYAISNVGARGLMQIMPATASFITQNKAFRGSLKSKLFDPDTNIKIGQQYLEYLLNSKQIDGNLLKLLVAYNAGPGTLNKLENKIINPNNDPLLFIESIPLKETRTYVKRVMANFWIYRNKLGHTSKSLVDLSNNSWPIYIKNTKYLIKDSFKYNYEENITDKLEEQEIVSN